MTQSRGVDSGNYIAQRLKSVFSGSVTGFSVIFISILLFASAGAAETFNVGDSAEHNTIQSALDAAANNGQDDKIIVHSGTYDGPVAITNSGVNLTAAAGSNPAITYEPGSPSGAATVDVAANDVEVSGFTIERVAHSDRIESSSHAQAVRVSASNTLVRDNELVGDLNGASTDVPYHRFDGMMVIDNDGLTTSNVEIKDNEVNGFYTGIMITSAYDGSVSRVNLEDNAVSGNEYGLVAKYHGEDGYNGSQPTDLTGLTNDFTGNAEQSIYVSDGGTYQGYNVADFDTSEINLEGPVLVEEGDSLQTAVDVAAQGSTVDVSAGTYDESVTVETDDLSFEGPNTGTEGFGSERSAEAIIADKFRVSSEGVTVNGMKFADSDLVQAVVVWGDQFELRNSIVDADNGVWIYNETRASKQNPSKPPVDTGVEVDLKSNLFRNKDSSISSGQFAVGGIEGGDQVTVDNNKFRSTAYAVVTSHTKGEVDFENQEGLAGVINDSSGWDSYFASIDKAAERANPGGQVEVLAGTYEESVSVGTSITLRGQGPSETTLDTGTAGRIDVSASDVTVEGFRVESNNSEGIYLGSGADDATVRENVLVDVSENPIDGTNAIRVEKNSALIEENEFRTHQHGVLVAQNFNETESVEIRDNQFIGNGLDGVFVVGSGSESSGHEIVNNTFRDTIGKFNDSGTILDIGAAVLLRETSSDIEDVTIRDNTFLNNSEYAVRAWDLDEDGFERVDARHNYWGQPTGPEEGQVSGNVTYRPWLLQEDGERYNDTFALEQGEWNLVSPAAAVDSKNLVGVEGDTGGTAVTYDDGWKSVSGDLNPLESYYFKPDQNTALGLNYGEGETVMNAGLSQGWNLIGSRISTEADNAFSTIQATGQNGMISMFVPEAANQKKQAGNIGTWETGQRNTVPLSDVTDVVSKRDGYWAYMNGEQTFSQVKE